MSIRIMTRADLRATLDWAAAEGWNPGLGDAAAFHAADPSGFLLKEVSGTPVAAISVVNHTAQFAFLGLYLCRREFRGQGHGIEVWRAGIRHAGARSIGLDGVPEQQANYMRSGFVLTDRTVRFEGRLAREPDPRIRPATPSQISALVARDARACGIRRTGFASAWFAQTPDRQTRVLSRGGEIAAAATFRRCESGTKIGPLYANTARDARALLASNPFAQADAPVFIDVPASCAALSELLTALKLSPVFETARMYRGVAPDPQPWGFQAIATMELG